VLRRVFPTRSHILRALMQDVFANVTLTAGGESPRDTLFDLIMAHFDALQNNRLAGIRLYKDLTSPRHLELLFRLRKPYWQQTNSVLTHAGISTEGLLGWGRVSLVALLGLWLLPIWVADESPDLSSTMAALDQGLQHLGDIQGIAARFGC
jgi:ubiquinone biosynthesis protein COQ9